MTFWIIWFLLGIGFVALYASLLFPRILLKMQAASLPIRGRAVGRVVDEHGAILLYESSPSVRGYIRSYRIGRDAKGKYFQGEWGRKIAYADYELVVYNSRNDIIDILRVKEKFNDDLTTHVTRLPKGADFVSLRLVCVDDTPFPPERRAFNARYAGWLAVLCASLAAAVDLLLWIAVTFAFRFLGGISADAAPTGLQWLYLLGGTALFVIVFTCFVVLMRYFCLYAKGVKHES